jgi:hypothetical protein
MIESTEDSERIKVWVAMADHFLDTETRHDIPPTALRCIHAGLSTEAARLVWQYEVSPAVGFNCWDMVGEWAGWNRDWLVKRIEGLRNRWDSRPGTCRWLRYRVRVHFIHNVWVAIGRCMDALLAVPVADDRTRMSRDLTYLARHYFDFCPDDPASLTAAERSRIRSLYPEPFQRIMAPAVMREEVFVADRRVRLALGE